MSKYFTSVFKDTQQVFCHVCSPRLFLKEDPDEGRDINKHVDFTHLSARMIKRHCSRYLIVSLRCQPYKFGSI